MCGRFGGEHPINHHSQARPKTCERIIGSRLFIFLSSSHMEDCEDQFTQSIRKKM